ncbi:TadE/TadG family type IV pilus assembly protein [Ramlibacter rhizophilus]|uniref:Pilus assembly protein n=1 Tax=Ramlibacter rhizophilus TaxID=1781167 RepID=A0A4Z0BG76_9BURK|nr:TadE/TadG family type IV pilus assembly protein [Ramlibacter rhizophilus]TFY96898.1 pilus assembly protein [Ramlibacter rhizophilus]
MPRIRHQRGVAILEFALVAPFLLMMVFITTEFGRAFYAYNTLAKSVRDASRYLSVYLPETHITEASNLIVYGSIQAGAQPQLVNLTAANVAAPVWGTAGAAPVINVVTVRVTGYQFPLLTASVFGLQFSGITFPDITATMRSPQI